MLYILECIFRCMGGGWDLGPLATTGVEETSKDVNVGICGLLLLVMVFDCIFYLTRYYIRRVNKKRKENNCADNNLDENVNNNVAEKGKVDKNKKLAKVYYFFECMAIGITGVLGEKACLMNTTGKKTTKKEVALFFVGWVMFLIITFVPLTLVLLFN